MAAPSPGPGRRFGLALLFGLAGLGANFLELQILQSPRLELAVVAGSFFPLLVTLAWGWRHGLLAALVSCQSLWWVWGGEGWGAAYAVPALVAWIGWHGWWADRRSEGHGLLRSALVVEIPFRLASTLGYLTLLPWLVSLSPAAGGPGGLGPSAASLAQTLAVERAVAAYVLLLAAHAALSLGPARRLFGLAPLPAQREINAVYACAMALAAALWLGDAWVGYAAFMPAGASFWESLWPQADPHERFMRLLFVLVSLAAAVLVARYLRQRARLARRLDHQNRVLGAIRSVNQLITQEKDRGRLLSRACRLLIDSRGFYNAWIGLVGDEEGRCTSFHAGFGGGFAAMTARLEAGELPSCARKALAGQGPLVVHSPPDECTNCPLARGYFGRAALVARLEHRERVFGWLAVSVPQAAARDREELGLFAELAADLGFALWSLGLEDRRAGLARRYARMLRFTSDAVITADLEGRFVLCNPAAEKLFNCKARDLVGSPTSRFCPEELRAEQAETMRRTLEAGSAPPLETVRLTADGRRVPVEMSLSLVTDAHDNPTGISAILRDVTERKQAEERLQRQQAMLARTEEMAQVGSWEWEVANDTVTWSPELYRIFQIDPSEPAPNFAQHPELYHPEDMGRLQEAVELALAEGAPYELELRARRRDGEMRYCLARGHAETDPQGRVVRLFGFVQDLTDRKPAEKALQALAETRMSASDDMFLFLVRQLAEALGTRCALLVRLDPDNPRRARGLALWSGYGFTDEFHYELSGTPCLRVALGGACFFPRRVQEAFPEDELLAELKAQAYWGAPLLDSRGRAAGVLAVLHDQPLQTRPQHLALLQSFAARAAAEMERREAERSRQEAEERFRLAFQTSPDSVNINRLSDGLYVEINQGFTDIMGYTREEVIGKTSLEMDIWVDPADRAELVRGLTERGAYANLEARFRRKDGSITTGLMSASIIQLAGEPHVISVTRDIGPMRRAEKERAELQERLQQAQKMEAVGTLAGGIAHDFNNVLAAITGYAELALDDAGKGRPVAEELGRILGAADRAKRLVNQILSFSRKAGVELQPVDLNRMIPEAVSVIERTIPKMISVELRLEPNLPMVSADPTQIEQILFNLAGNAQDAMPGGGRLTLETQEVNLDRAEAQRLPGAKPGRYVQTTVSDTGVGMDAETASRVFEPFFTTKETGKGTGLGLSSVYGIVKRHQGFIYCHSRRGEGASFRILLPALEETRRPSRPPAEAAEAEGPASGGGTILLVDDEETLRTVGSRLLESAGYRVLTAASGEEAVELYRREGSGVDLVLMDLNMPGMGGRQAMDEIAALDPRAKVLVTTGYSDQPQVRDAASATGGGYLAKPFRRSELLSAVRRVLDGGPSRTS